MTSQDRTYDEALRQRAANLRDVLAGVETHLDELRRQLRYHLELGDIGTVPAIRSRLALAVALHDEAADDLAEILSLIDARGAGRAG